VREKLALGIMKCSFNIQRQLTNTIVIEPAKAVLVDLKLWGRRAPASRFDFVIHYVMREGTGFPTTSSFW